MSLTSLKENYIIYLMYIIFGTGDVTIYSSNVIDSGEHTQAHPRNPRTHPRTVAQAPETPCHQKAQRCFCICTELEYR